MTDLPRTVSVGWLSQGIRQGFVVGEDMEHASFHKMTEVFDGHVDCQEIPAKGSVSP